ncbi:hypothetical protein RB195_004380 [Necator americanus]|uniref:Uncharacterized protein n=1 Tax=Necator americanus TaxID=51031 RepID=A0ABR1BHV8_NECAM
MLSDVTLHSLVIESKKPPKASYSECSTMTDAMKTEDKETDPMERRSTAVQTEVDNVEVNADGVMISEETITLVESMLHDSAASRIYDRLLSFHSTSLVQLQPIRTCTVSLLSTETLDVVSLSSGSAGRVAILIGETDHDTWCCHEGKIIVSQRSKATSIPLAVCPSSSSWSPQGVLAVGDVAGDVHVVIGETVASASKWGGVAVRSVVGPLLAPPIAALCDGPISVPTAVSTAPFRAREGVNVQVHSQTVSALDWISNSQLISCGEDGNIIISQLKGTGLENVKTLRLSVSDLPRQIRNSASSEKPVSIISMSRSGDEACIATETGGIWIVPIPDLRLKTIPSEPQAVHTIVYTSPFIALSGDDDSTILLNNDGSFVDTFPVAGRQMCKVEEFMVFADGSRMIIYDITTRRVVLDERRNSRGLCATPLDDIVIISENELITLRLVKSSS